ncbi:carboxylesterase/lipase family protein [Mesorhizobium sp. 1B3]|uniref:carboxylesterase/lipase family protein n=1 Tax=Mesorhizobium sp. 1B3 TaxID=3243599 RepID=UPI003D991B74
MKTSLSIAAAACGILVLPGLASAQQKPVETTSGSVVGVESSYVPGVTVFKGIRYGADTGGENRFLPPKPAEKATEVYEAKEYGKACYGLGFPPFLMQEEGVDLDKSPMSEDCLFLNIWTPTIDAGKRPVMVWFHGGGFTSGSGGSIRYEGSNLVARKDVVLVTVNHRLGALGFMDVSDIGGEAYADSGNVGMLDIVQSLQWVHDNIAAFGGDPENVTVFGESGGGSKVTTLLSMPAAKGLFHKAIAQSGINMSAIPAEKAHETAEAAVAELKVDSIEALKRAAPDTITNAKGSWGPVIGRSLPRSPFDPDADPAGKDIPLMIGSNLTEATFFSTTPLSAVDEAGLKEAFAKGNFTAKIPAETIPELMTAYRAELSGTPDHEIYQIIASDAWMTRVVDKAAKLRADIGAPTYVYQFTMRQGARDGALNVPHTAEIAYAFDNLALAKALVGEPDEKDQALADLMSAAWTNFARTGNPQGEDVPEWPAFTSDRHAVMILGEQSEAAVDPFAQRLKALGAAK